MMPPCATRHSTTPPPLLVREVNASGVTGPAEDGALNFGGQQQELWCEGGEVAFILRMIAESKGFGRQVKWFTTLVSRGDNLPPLYRALTDVGAVKVVKRDGAGPEAEPLYCPVLYGR